MQRHLYLICIILTSSCLGQTKHIDPKNSDLKEWGLRGKIKTMTLSTKFVINDTLFATIQTIANYNEAGNVTTVERIVKNSRTNKVEKSFMVFKYMNQDRFGAELEKKDTVSTLNRKWLTKNSYREELYDKKENLLTIGITKLNEENKIEFDTNKIYKNKDTLQLESIRVSQYLFDKNNRLTAVITKDAQNNETTETNEDLEFDKNGNATKSIKSIIGKRQKKIILRQFEYFE